MIDRPETLRLLRIAHDEIVSLRRTNAVLAPKAHAYDTIAAVARLRPEVEIGYGIDVEWELRTAVEKIVAERDAEPVAEPPAQPEGE